MIEVDGAGVGLPDFEEYSLDFLLLPSVEKVADEVRSDSLLTVPRIHGKVQNFAFVSNSCPKNTTNDRRVCLT